MQEEVQRRIDQLLEEAHEAISKSDWATVVNCADHVLRIDADNVDARACLTAFEKTRGTNSLRDLEDPAKD